MDIFKWENKQIGFFRITGYVINNNINIIYDNNSDKSIDVWAIQEQKMLRRILNRNSWVKNISLIIQIRHIYKKVRINNIYRIELLDDNWKVVDAINTHHDWVPKEIREEFNRQFRNEDGTDRVVPLENV